MAHLLKYDQSQLLNNQKTNRGPPILRDITSTKLKQTFFYACATTEFEELARHTAGRSDSSIKKVFCIFAHNQARPFINAEHDITKGSQPIFPCLGNTHIYLKQGHSIHSAARPTLGVTAYLHSIPTHIAVCF